MGRGRAARPGLSVPGAAIGEAPIWGPPPGAFYDSGSNDPPARGDPRQAPDPTRRLPDEGRPGPGAIRRQGPEPAQPRSELLAEGGRAGPRAAPHPGGD